MPQVVIQRGLDDKYLKRKRSYNQTTWTADLQDAQVFTEQGAERCINSIVLGYYEGNVKRRKELLYTRAVQLRLKRT